MSITGWTRAYLSSPALCWADLYERLRIPKTTATRYRHTDEVQSVFIGEAHDTCRATGYDTARSRQTHTAGQARDHALRASGVLDRVIKVGDRLPPFALKNAFGEEVRSSELLANGPLVLTVFRGSW